MSIALGLLAAVAFGTCDFFAGLASRRMHPAAVSATAQLVALVTALVSVLLFPGDGPTTHALAWGAVGGAASGCGTLALYHGMAVGRMSVVATLSGLMTAVIPVLVGVAGGDTLTMASAIGIVLAIPATGLVSWHPSTAEHGGRAGPAWGFLSGFAFAILFIALDRAGTQSGAWPVVSSQVGSVLVTLPIAVRALARGTARVGRQGVYLAIAAGVLIGIATLSFLAATHTGQLAIVIVLTALYPGVTAILARVLLAEHWTPSQRVGLLAAFAAILLISAGSA